MLKKIRSHARLLLVILTPVFFTSCVAVSQGELNSLRGNAVGAIGRRGGGSAEKQRFIEDNKKTVRQPTVVGGVLGAAGGAALYKKFGVGGVLAGAAIGGAVGNMAGRSKAAKKAVAQKREADLDSAIAGARRANQQARARVTAAKNAYQKLQARANAARKSGNKSELAKIKREANSQKTALASQSKSLGSKISSGNRTLQSAGSGHSQYRSYSSEISNMKQTKSDTDSLSRQYGSLLNSL